MPDPLANLGPVLVAFALTVGVLGFPAALMEWGARRSRRVAAFLDRVVDRVL